MAQAQRNLGRVREAIANYREALRLNPAHAEAHNNLANSLLLLKQIDQAIGHYEQALRINRDYAEAHCNLAMVRMQQGQFSKAVPITAR